ncbi:general secretion pathway protein GspB [Thalassotalea sp. PS06]|uniref:general secretion pathway protein GspB n=1 Tax=Thalassotalea sp. PS06 TaxID=2594005 RepID=UPI0011641DEB|nr:general secretion pathway protein GspB [Thalassotalea sp. PS06]QDP02278.1 hypothetical protein FNC98_13560 [Thalassotalea sp. PS06]
MSYILDALKKDPKSQQQLHIDPLRQYHQSGKTHRSSARIAIITLLSISGFCASYWFFGGGNWVKQTWFANDVQIQQQEPLRTSFHSAHPLAQYFADGQTYNQQLVTLRKEQRELENQQLLAREKARQQESEQRQSQLIAEQVDSAIAKHSFQAQNASIRDAQAADNTDSNKPRIALTAQEQEQISPELLAAFNQAVDEAYADEQETERVESLIAKAKADIAGAKANQEAAQANQGQPVREVPLLAQLPDSFRNSVPPIQFSLHMYSSDIDSRWIRMNGQDYFEGGISPEGIEVEQIDPQFVVLNYRGKSFRLPALSSW